MLRDYKVGNKVIKIEPYSALPCSLMIFTIDDMDAIDTDFGFGGDKNPWEAEEYGCADWYFERYTNNEEIKRCMDKYSLTLEEYKEISSILEQVLYVGECGWCI